MKSRMLSVKQIEEKEAIKKWAKEKVPISEIASRLNKTVSTIYYHMRSLGIYKPREYKFGKVKQPEPKKKYELVEPEEIDFSKLPSDALFKHDRTYIF